MTTFPPCALLLSTKTPTFLHDIYVGLGTENNDDLTVAWRAHLFKYKDAKFVHDILDV